MVQLGPFGIWRGAPDLDERLAATVESLGYDTIWIGGSPDGELDLVDRLLAATTSLTVATGIVNIWKDEAQAVARSYHRIESRFPGRFLLGIGAGHPEATAHTRSRMPRWSITSTSSTRPRCR